MTDRYGREHAALVASFATYRSRGAIRDVGKALGLPFADLERLAKLTDGWNAARVGDELLQLPDAERKLASPRWRAFAELCAEIGGLPRHISQHPGGMVISSRPLVELVPVQPAAMAGRQMCQWDKDSCADAGFLKIDLLGLGMLSAVEECVDLIARNRGEEIDLSRIPLDDPDVFAEIQKADTVGCFQIESRAQMQTILRTRPENLDDITIQVALVRPGPIQGKAVHPYIERRQKLREDPAYEPPADHPLLKEPLRETLGVVVFQDQVLDVADPSRRLHRRRGGGTAARDEPQALACGARVVARSASSPARSRTASTRRSAHAIYDKLVAFSGFGFPKSHSAAFGLLAYQSAWLRHHYGAEFLASLLNAQPMGFYPPATLVRDALRRGVETRTPDVNRSEVGCTIEDGAVRVGLKYVQGVGEDDAEVVVANARPYASDPRARAADALSGDELRALVESGACDSFGLAAPRPPVAARARAARADGAGLRRRGEAARAAARADGGDARPAGADRVGADARRLPDDEPLDRRAPDRAACARTCRRTRSRPSSCASSPHARRRADRRHGRRAAAAGDRERRRLHAARGRARAGEPHRVRRRCTTASAASCAASRSSSSAAGTSTPTATATSSSTSSSRSPRSPASSPTGRTSTARCRAAHHFGAPVALQSH